MSTHRSALRGSVGLLIVVAAWSTFASACGTSSFTASSDSGAGTACWPSGSCPGNTICCVGVDESSQCTSVSQCPTDHASLACLRPSDCDAGYCCVRGTEFVDGGVTTIAARSACSPTDCPPIGGSFRICGGPADCAAGTTCRAEPEYVPPNFSLCTP